MDNKPSLKKNYIYRFLYEILTMITPFITAPYVSRVLGADGIGIYSYTQSYMTYFTMFAALGTVSYGMREIARCRNDKYEYSKKFWEIELLTVFTTCICLLAWFVFIFFSDFYRIYFIALIPSLFAMMFDISWFYTGHEKVGYTVFWNAICKILGVACIFLFINDKSDLFLYIFLNTLILMIGNISMWVFLPKMLVRVNIKEFRFKSHFKETLIYFVPTIATSVYTVLDKTLIGMITRSGYENGYYEQATKIINMAKTAVFISVNTVMEARISYLFAENRINEIKCRINKSMDYILLLGYGAMFGIIGVAKVFVPIFFGEGFESVTYLLYWMAPLIVIIGISNCLGSQYYTPAGLRKQSAMYIIIGSCVNLIMNLILIPKSGSIGAVIGSIIAELTISVLYLLKCRGYLTVKQLWVSSYKRIISGAIMLVIVRLIGKYIGDADIRTLFIQVVVGVIAYFALLFIMKDKMLKEFIKMLIRRVKK